MPNTSAPLAAETAFDTLAADYDRTFTQSKIGQAQRSAVWHQLADVFPAGSRVLELGCGTGEDALFLARRGCEVVATDRSPAMVDTARRKILAAEPEGFAGHVELAVMDARSLAQEPDEKETPFDGVLANFGVINCVGDGTALASLGVSLAARVRTGGRAMLCVMGPVVPWEWLWFMTHGQPRTALRRFRRGGVLWRGLRVRYPSVGRLSKILAPAWQIRRTTAVGALVPPSYAEPWAQRHPTWIDRLARIERRFETFPPLVRLADHYLLELERT